MITARASGLQRGRMSRTAMAMIVTLSSIAMACIFLSSYIAAHASGVIEVPTQQLPWGIAFDKSGHVWVAEPGCDPAPACSSAFPATIGEYNLSNASLVKNYNEPSGFSSPLFLAIDGSGNLWFTELNSNAIGELTPASSTWNQWNVPTANSVPYDLVFDGRGNLWFTEFSGNKVGFFNKTKHTFVETATPTANSHPYGITRTSSGQIWFAENNAGKIGSFSPTKSGKVTISEHPITAQSPHLITSDKSGNIWYSEGFAGKIGEFMPRSNTSKDFNVSCSCPGGIHISGIAVDSKGRIWFDDSLSARVGYYNPATSTVTTLTLSNPNAHPHDGLGLDSSGNTWFTEEFASQLGEIPAGSL